MIIKYYREYRIYSVFRQAKQIDFFIPKYNGPGECSLRLSVSNADSIRGIARQFGKYANTFSEVSPCGWDAIVDFRFISGRERFLINRECGYILNDGILGDWKSYHGELDAYFAQAEAHGVAESLCVSP